MDLITFYREREGESQNRRAEFIVMFVTDI